MTIPISRRDRRYLNRLNKKLTESDNEYDKITKDTKKTLEKEGKSNKEIREEIQGLQADWWFNQDQIQDDIAEHITKSLFSEAFCLIIDPAIPSPSSENGNKYWKKTRTGGVNVLNSDGISVLKSTIREERSILNKEEKEKRDRWIPWITVLAGIIGGVTGLLAVIGTFFK